MGKLGLLTSQNKDGRDCHLQLPGQRFGEKRKASQRCTEIGQEAKDVGWKEGI